MKILFSLLLLMVSLPIFAEKYVIDPDYSTVSFSVPFMTYGKIYGHFDTINGKITLDKEGNIKKISGEIPVNSLSTGNEKRDSLLLSDAFFDERKFDKIVFKSLKISADEGTQDGIVHMIVYINGIKTLLEAPIKVKGVIVENRREKHMFFHSEIDFERNKYGMNYNVFMNETPLIGEVVHVTFDIKATRKKLF
jgi:polyisoprenoid-binding protein YceI